MTDYTLGHVRDLEDNPAWREILERFQKIAVEADARMEKADLAVNREATGERRVARALLGIAEVLKQERERR